MANPEHEAILQKGVEEWNKWRKKNPNVWPDLTERYGIERKYNNKPDVPLRIIPEVHWWRWNV